MPILASPTRLARCAENWSSFSMHSAHRTFRKGLHAAPGIFLGLLFAAPLGAQSSPELQQILTRLERLEQQNRELMQEVHSLREELATARPRPAQETAPPPSESVPLDERVAVAERRIDEQAQSKVESSQRFPLRVTGIALFNTYLNSKQGGGAEYPTIASAPGAATGGDTLRQTVLGLEYQGPETFAGGRVKGSLYMDFFPAGTQALRIRTGDVELDWGSRSLLAGLEKPIFNPREPNSLAQVGISPLTGAGNLWLWIPQLRFEQDFSFGPGPACARKWESCKRASLSHIRPAITCPNWKPRGPASKAASSFSTGWTTTGGSNLLRGFTRVSRT